MVMEISGHRVKLKAVEDEADLTPENLTRWLAQAEAEVKEGKVSDAREGLAALREKYGL